MPRRRASSAWLMPSRRRSARSLAPSIDPSAMACLPVNAANDSLIDSHVLTIAYSLNLLPARLMLTRATSAVNLDRSEVDDERQPSSARARGRPERLDGRRSAASLLRSRADAARARLRG